MSACLLPTSTWTCNRQLKVRAVGPQHMIFPRVVDRTGTPPFRLLKPKPFKSHWLAHPLYLTHQKTLGARHSKHTHLCHEQQSQSICVSHENSCNSFFFTDLPLSAMISTNSILNTTAKVTLLICILDHVTLQKPSRGSQKPKSYHGPR